MAACVSGAPTIMGNDILKPLYIRYPASRLTVTLRYTGLSGPKLQYIALDAPEKTAPGQESPDAFIKNMSGLAESLDAKAKAAR
jgi:hypothetical protein